MPTIAKTKWYHELTLRYLKLIRLYSVMSELRLHTNKAVDVDAAKFYHSVLYEWGDYGAFLGTSLESMTQAFYIELDGFIGGYWDSQKQKVISRKYEHGSLAQYLYDGTRTVRKRSAIQLFETLLKNEADELEMMHDLRHHLAHFVKLNKRNNSQAPGDRKIREILNSLADILFLLGFQRWNKPHYVEQDNDYTAATQDLIDKLSADNSKSKEMRQRYVEARTKWFGDQS